mmetsp:Transcript_93789/g.186019  ORF Transcript_93789/g.186019 Transcript_93789/m.186019 type:complete len:106 (+) Transcript_93789:827-1144(+)
MPVRKYGVVGTKLLPDHRLGKIPLPRKQKLEACCVQHEMNEQTHPGKIGHVKRFRHVCKEVRETAEEIQQCQTSQHGMGVKLVMVCEKLRHCSWQLRKPLATLQS